MGRVKMRGKDLLVRGNTNVSNDLTVNEDLDVKKAFAFGSGTLSGVIKDVATVTTTDNTKTDVAAIAVGANQVVMVVVKGFGREKAGGKDHGVFGIVGAAQRDGTGNVTAVDTDAALFTAMNTDSWGGITTDVNTTDQTLEISVTGKTGTNITWFLNYEYMIFTLAHV